MHRRILVPVLLAGCAAASASLCRADDAPPKATPPDPIAAIAAKLPPDVADAVRKWLPADPKEAKAASILSPMALDQAVMVDLASVPPAAEFVLARMATETPQTDILVLHVIGVDAFWVDESNVTGVLQRIAESTPDQDLMLVALDVERRIEVKRLRKTLTARIAAARQSGDAKALQVLAAADERWELVERGASLPAYLRKPPALFSVKPADQPIRIVALGDFGSGLQGQRDVAAAIVRMGKAQPFDFGITLGDNFYPTGMSSPTDPRWRDWWEALYGPLGVPFYPSLGNHEWYSDDGAAGEIAYRSPTWHFPSPYYTYTAGPVQFFAVDTTEISEAEIIWLDRQVSASTSRWKVVYGHHPIFAPERNAVAGNYMPYMQEHLWPVIRGRVDAYLCGHQHAMAHMDTHEGVHFFMSGGGGGALSMVANKDPDAVFAASRFGFLTLEADAAQMTIALVGTDGKAFDSEVITK